MAISAEKKFRFGQAETLKTLDTVVLKTATTSGIPCVVKLYRPHRRPLLEQIFAIDRFLTFVKRKYPRLRLQTLITPAILPFDYGHWQGKASDPRLLIAYRWQEGEKIQQITPALCRTIGRRMGWLHRCASEYPETISLYHINHNLPKDVSRLTDSSALFKGMPVAVQTAFNSEIQRLSSFLQSFGYDRDRYGIIHSDLHFANWLRTPSSLLPIDFDEAAYGHYLTDLAVVCCEIDTDAPAEQRADCERALLEGYQQTHQLPENWPSLLPDFKKIALALYLHWALNPENAEVLEDSRKRFYAEQAVEGVGKV